MFSSLTRLPPAAEPLPEVVRESSDTNIGRSVACGLDDDCAGNGLLLSRTRLEKEEGRLDMAQCFVDLRTGWAVLPFEIVGPGGNSETTDLCL